MIRAGQYPGGRRLRTPLGLKIKGLNVVHTAANGNWGAMWSTFDWTGWIKPQIDLSKQLGANLVKVTAAGTSGYPSDPILAARINQFLDYTARQGLHVYWNYASTDWGGSDAVATTAIKKIAALLDPWPHVVGLDVANEVGLQVSNAQVSNIPALVAAARAATSIPLTASISVSAASDLLNANATGVAPYVDFMDFHPYYSTGEPAVADWAAYRASRFYKPWIVGECGQRTEAGTTAQTARWNALGALSRATDCGGVVGFSVADYSTSEHWGVYPADLSAPRTAISTPFATWPTSA